MTYFFMESLLSCPHHNSRKKETIGVFVLCQEIGNVTFSYELTVCACICFSERCFHQYIVVACILK